jgi:DNA-binding response OmpR family regulator
MRALIVDDDHILADLLAFTLRREGFEPLLAFDAAGAMMLFHKQLVDIIILDVNLPGGSGLENGFDICQAIRQESSVPIILLTVRDEEADVVKGLELGADDYVLKPFSPRQLVARVNSLIRRSSMNSAPHEAPYTCRDIKFDPNLREFAKGDQPSVLLTRLESRLLSYLMLNSGQVLPSENIIAYVWGPGGGSTEMLRQLVRRLRVKIEEDPTNPEWIKNLGGVGYGFNI